jgi:thiamine biosynthesis lipoprotein
MHINQNISFLVKTAVMLLLLCCVSCTPRKGYVTITGYAQGGTYAVKFIIDGVSQKPEEIRDSIEMILHRIDFSLSGYNKNSLLSHFNAGEIVIPDPLFMDMYSRAYEFWEKTDGFVDAASAPLFDLWGFGFKSGEMPSDEIVARTLKESGMKRLRADIRSAVGEDGTLEPADLLDKFAENTSSSETTSPVAPKLNYNAIAQGYSCDLVAAYLYSIGVKDMMVDIGEIYCDGVNPSGKRWTIGIDRPVDGNNELGADIQGIFRVPSGPHGVVTSGNYRKFYVRDGRKYAHTIDPQTGYPVSHSLLSATILASDAITADAYATYCMVIGLDAAKAFIESRPDLEACLIYDSDGAFATWCSSGFSLEASATSTR